MWILRISTHARNFCSITLWCTTFDLYFNIGSIPHGGSEFFLCPMLVTRPKKTIFLYFNIGVVTPQMFFGNKGKKNKNNVYVWKLYSIKIHLLHPFVYQYLSLPITIECYWGQKKCLATCTFCFSWIIII